MRSSSLLSEGRTRPHLVTAALLVGTFLSALDMNVVGTALPTMVGQLGGLELYGMVIAAYLLTSTSTLPLYGRLADLYGRKPVYLAATALFLGGSALCGAAPTMAALVAFRAVQGLGAGGLMPITITLFGDLYPAGQRALVQGLFSTVWGVSSVLGPLLGGFFVTFVSWRWIFWINIPTGLLAAGLLYATLHEKPGPGGTGRLDLPGALLLVLTLVCLLLGLQGLEGLFAPGVTYTLLGLALLFGLAFALTERRVASPLLPLSLLRSRALLVTAVSGLCLGGVMFCVVTFIPMYVQGVLHGSPTRAGLALVPLSVAWTLATFTCGPLARALGYRPVAIAGSLLCAAGAAFLLKLPVADAMLRLHVPMISIGAGMGLNITVTIIAVQDDTAWDQRGVATALMSFARTIGGMIAVAVLGLLITSAFAEAVSSHLGGAATAEALLDPARWADFSPRVLSLGRAALDTVIQRYLWVVAALGAAALAVTFFFPGLRMDEGRQP